MVVYLLEKTFTAGKTYATREYSDKIRLPKGVIIQIASKGESACTDLITWWLEIAGRRFFPYQTTKNTHGLKSKTSLGHIDEWFPIDKRGLDIRLVGYHSTVNGDKWMQVFITVIPQKDLEHYKKYHSS